IGRCVGVCTNFQSLVLVCQLHDTSEVTAVGIGRNSLDFAVVNLTCGTVQRNGVAFVEDFSAKFELLVCFVHFDVAATGYAACSHTTCNNCSVRSLSATNGKNTLCVLHAFDVFGGCFKTNKHNLFLCLAEFNCIFRCEHYRSCCSAG